VGGGGQASKGACPEVVELAPVPLQPLLVDAVDAMAPRLRVLDDPGALEHLEVLAHRRSTDRHHLGQLGHGARADGQSFDDGAPASVAEKRPRIKRVSHHEHVSYR
jgi:hypothetical protein